MSAPVGAAAPAEPAAVQLSTTLVTFAAEDPGGWSATLAWTQLLDQAGVDKLVVSDHVAFGEHLDAYGDPASGGTAGGVQPTGPDGHWLEPMTTLAVVAGMTTRIRLGTNILIAALRRPVVLAKSASTLDVLSGGRLDLGVGVGWQREEYEASGLDYHRRGRLLDDTLDVCRTLWTETRASHDSPDLSFDAIHQMPKPLRRTGVPIWVAGTVNPRVVDRLARFGTGWIPWGVDAADPATGITAMQRALEDAEHDPSGLQVVGTLPVVRREDRSMDVDRTMAAVPALVEAGVTDLRLSLRPAAGPEAAEHLRSVVSAFRSAAGRHAPA